MAYMTKVAQIAQRALTQRAKDNEEIDNLRSKLMISAMQTKFKNEYAARKLQEQRAYDLRKSVWEKKLSLDFSRRKEILQERRPLSDSGQSSFRATVKPMIENGIFSPNHPIAKKFRNNELFNAGDNTSLDNFLKRMKTRRELGMAPEYSWDQEIGKAVREQSTNKRYGVGGVKLDAAGRSISLTGPEKRQNVTHLYATVAQKAIDNGWVKKGQGKVSIVNMLREKYPNPLNYGESLSRGIGVLKHRDGKTIMKRSWKPDTDGLPPKEYTDTPQILSDITSLTLPLVGMAQTRGFSRNRIFGDPKNSKFMFQLEGGEAQDSLRSKVTKIGKWIANSNLAEVDKQFLRGMINYQLRMLSEGKPIDTYWDINKFRDINSRALDSTGQKYYKNDTHITKTRKDFWGTGDWSMELQRIDFPSPRKWKSIRR